MRICAGGVLVRGERILLAKRAADRTFYPGLMNRRTFLCGLTLGTLAAPLTAGGQQGGKVSRVGFMFFGAPGPSAEADAFRRVMK